MIKTTIMIHECLRLRKRYELMRYSMVSLFLSLLLFLCCSQIATADRLDEQIYALTGKGQGFKTNTASLAQEYLALLNEYDDPGDVGRIYAALTNMFCQAGLTDPDSAVKYAQKALEYPQDPVTQMRLYCQWGDGLQVMNRGVTGDALSLARRIVVKPYLDGLNLALKHETPDEKVPIPRGQFNNINGPLGSTEREQLLAEERASQEAQQRAQFLNNMVEHRDTLTNQIVFLYSRFPFDSKELRRIALETLEDESAVEKLMAKVDAEISDRLEKMPMPDSPVDLILDRVQQPESMPASRPTPSQAAHSDDPKPEQQLNTETDEHTRSRSRLLLFIVPLVIILASAALWKARTIRS